MPYVEPRSALWRLGTLLRLKAESTTDSARALFEEATDFYRRAMAAECKNWSRTHPNVSDDFPAIISLPASKADATQLAFVPKRLLEIIDPEESEEAANFIARLALPGELLAAMERHPHVAGRGMD